MRLASRPGPISIILRKGPRRPSALMTVAPPSSSQRTLPPVIGRLLSGTFWLALRTPIQAVLVFFSVPLALRYIGPANNGAYVFAWGFGFLQFLLEFGM